MLDAAVIVPTESNQQSGRRVLSLPSEHDLVVKVAAAVRVWPRTPNPHLAQSKAPQTPHTMVSLQIGVVLRDEVENAL